MNNLSDVTDQFVLTMGAKILHDIDTPSFMRKENGITLGDRGKCLPSGIREEPDEKIVRFLSIIKQKDFVISAG